MNIRLILPTMIETDINVWQGCMKFHNVPELIRKYDGKTAFIRDRQQAGGLRGVQEDRTGAAHLLLNIVF